MDKISVVIPAKNEAHSLANLLPALREQLPDADILVINDGSSDETAEICTQHGVKVINHPYTLGNGAAIKTGARAAPGDVIVFMDADGQHRPEDIPKLLQKLAEGFDMVVGARYASGHANISRWGANFLYNGLASWMVGQKIEDLTSGFRAVKAEKFREFVYLLPNGFSYPTTITMSFFRAGYTVGYMPIGTRTRKGRSHIRPIRDGVRFLLIIFRVGTLYSPLKLFVPISATFFSLGLGYYLYTYLTQSRFTNMSALLLTTSIVIFLIGLVSEQITNLLYTRRSE